MDTFQSFILGLILGGGAVYYATWYHARKIEALLGPGALKKWDLYNAKADHASPTGRIVTDA